MSGASTRQPSSSERLELLIEDLELSPFQKQLLRDRWLNQLRWMSAKASWARRWYLAIRLPVVVGGVAIPGLITILLSRDERISWLFNLPIDWIRLTTFVVSISVAILAAAEEVLNYGARWRHYRRTSELLKTLGWQFLELSGAFRRYPSHAAAFTAFSERVENALNEDVAGYLGEIASESGDRTRTDIIA